MAEDTNQQNGGMDQQDQTKPQGIDQQQNKQPLDQQNPDDTAGQQAPKGGDVEDVKP